jgi:hypothetical protein
VPSTSENERLESDLNLIRAGPERYEIPMLLFLAAKSKKKSSHGSRRSGHYRQPASRRLLPPLADMWRSKLIIARGMRGAATMRVLAVG